MAQVLKEEVRNRILEAAEKVFYKKDYSCLLYTSPSPRDYAASRMPSSA